MKAATIMTLSLTLVLAMVVGCRAKDTSSGADTDRKLARADKYTAVQKDGVVTLTATGQKPSPNYKVYFEKGAIEIFPPVFTLWWEAPKNPDAQVITPFSATTTFKAAEPVTSKITVTDGSGKREVSVTQG